MEGSQLIQILSCNLPPSVTGSASCPAGSSEPSSVSNDPQAGPCSSPQYAEGLLLHNADLLAALLNGAAGSTGSVGALHTQQSAPAALHSLKQAVQQHQALLVAPGSFLTAAGAASAAAVTSTEQHVPGDPTQSSPACFQLLTAVGRLLKGLVQLCLHQYDDFVASGMTYWLIGGSRNLMQQQQQLAVTRTAVRLLVAVVAAIVGAPAAAAPAAVAAAVQHQILAPQQQPASSPQSA